jgi:transposase InsO family protein
MPFAAQRRHQFWTVDIRYLDTPLLEGKAYAITILENFSRAIVASMVSPTQDLAAYLKVLRAASDAPFKSPPMGVHQWRADRQVRGCLLLHRPLV